MIKHTHKCLAASLLLAVTSTGCMSWPSSASNDPSFDSTEEKLVEAQRQIGAQQEDPGFMGSLQSAFTPQVKVNKAADPIALRNQPKQVGADVFLTAGAFYESQGQLDKARSQYERALATEPNQLYGLISLARLADRMGNTPEAENRYNQAIAAHPSSGLAYNDMGLFLARKGNPQQAAAALEQATSLDPTNVRYLNNHATVLVEIGQYDMALNQLRKVSSEAEAHYNLGYLLHRNEQNQLAMQHFAEAARLNPQLQQAHAMLAKLGGNQPPAMQPPSNQQAQAYPAVHQYQQQQAAQSGYSLNPQYSPYGASQGSVYTASDSPMRQLPPVQR